MCLWIFWRGYALWPHSHRHARCVWCDVHGRAEWGISGWRSHTQRAKITTHATREGRIKCHLCANANYLTLQYPVRSLYKMKIRALYSKLACVMPNLWYRWMRSVLNICTTIFFSALLLTCCSVANCMTCLATRRCFGRPSLDLVSSWAFSIFPQTALELNEVLNSC